MKRAFFPAAIALLIIPLFAWAAGPSAAVNSSVVFIANYDDNNTFVGWGTGFFVDEGIVVTNKHVINSGDWYRVFATGADNKVNLDCWKNITKSDVRINLDDDVAYMRVYLNCEHGQTRFADDPEIGDPVWVLGYPLREGSDSLDLSITSGSVIGMSEDNWLETDAFLDRGNSGGPVVNETGVVGVAVAKGVNAQGEFVLGYFIPSSVIERGLLYANDSGFGYTAQSRSSSSRRSSSLSSSVSSQSSVISQQSSSRRSALSSRVSSHSSSAIPMFPDVRITREGYDAIRSLYEQGIIGGYPDGTFRPSAGINRAEFIKILVGGFRKSTLRGESDCFSDVADEWFAEYVCAAERLGWIDGYPDPSASSGQATLFKPAQQINRAEAMKIVIQAFGETALSTQGMPSDVSSDTWFYAFVSAGVKLGIVDPDVLFQPARDLTREEAAMWIDGAM